MDSAKGWRRLSDSEASVVTRPSPGASPPGMTERGLAARADETDQSQPVLPALRFHSFHGFLPERFQSFVLSDLKLVLNKMLFRVPSDEFSWHRLYDICPANTKSRQQLSRSQAGYPWANDLSLLSPSKVRKHTFYHTGAVARIKCSCENHVERCLLNLLLKSPSFSEVHISKLLYSTLKGSRFPSSLSLKQLDSL